jgi:hypothetical protein
MTLERAIAIFNANYKKEWRQSTSEKRQKLVINFWNQYVEQLLYADKAIDEETAIKWYSNYYKFVNAE